MMNKLMAAALAVIMMLYTPVFSAASEYIEEESIEANQLGEQVKEYKMGDQLAEYAQSAVLMELKTGKILFEKNAEEQREPASITKIMTMALVLEQIQQGNLTYEDMITASQHAKEMGGTQINLDVGEQMKLYDLLMAVAVASANDASVALAEHIGEGSESAFVDRMNQKAKELGMTQTVFKNSNGLPDQQHLTSAKDIALMSRYLLSFESASEFIGTDRYPIRSGENEYMMRNSNALVREYDGCVGVKTGYTQAAGHCVSAAATRGDMTLIAVVLGEPESKIRFLEAAALLDYGFDQYTLFTPDVSMEQPAPIKVSRGLAQEVEVVSPLEKVPPQVVNRSAQPKVETKVTLEEKLEAPIQEGQKVGTFTVMIDGEAIYEYEYTAKQSVGKRTFFNCVAMVLSGMIKI